MNKLNALNTEGQEIVLGRTEVVVQKKENNEMGREVIRTIHKGVVIAKLDSRGESNRMVRVYAHRDFTLGENKEIKINKDSSPENTEWLPWNAPNCWCIIIGMRKESDAFAIPAMLR